MKNQLSLKWSNSLLCAEYSFTIFQNSIYVISTLFPFLLQIAEDGGIESAIRCNRGLKTEFTYHGLLTNKAIADWFNLEYRDINLIVFKS